MTVSHQVDRASSHDSLPRTSGSTPIGTATSKARPTSGPKKSGPVTPMIVNRDSFEIEPLADRVGRAAELPLPEAVADDRDRAIRSAAARVVGWRERAAEHRRHAERVEHAAARPEAVHELRLAAGREVEPLVAPRERPSNRSRRDRICSQIGFVHDRRPVPLLITVPSVISASCCGALTGSARSSRLLTSEKIAVLAPMPSASDSAATRETTGVARSARTARRRSCTGPPEGRIIYDAFRRSQRQDRVVR